MGFIEAIKSFYGRYVDFQTRSTRSEYWWIVLYQIIVGIILAIPVMGSVVSVAMSGGLENDPMAMYGAFFSLSGLPIILFALVNFIPGIALAVRRIHDFDRTGWLYLIVIFGGMIPIIGMLVSLGWLIVNFFKGTTGPNRFGDDPLDPISDTFN
ncbi:MAG: DUF805 domain-containing protein [Robiginitomaculum sp.]|nr:MAG: DUF805 domain-containing protein [Robiginitomaculum sp.]